MYSYQRPAYKRYCQGAFCSHLASSSFGRAKAQVRQALSIPLQTKLTVGAPNDKYEQEADRVADQVMAMPDPKLQRQMEHEEEEEMLKTKPLADQITPSVQRQEEPPEGGEEEPVQAKFRDGEMLRRECTECDEDTARRQPNENEEEEEDVQAKSKAGVTPSITPNMESRINNLKGGGQVLDPSTRAFFEPRFGRDFSQVRIHTDAHASETARALNAQAYTVGRDVVFGAGRYAPETIQGKRLIGHELTHVVQQHGSRLPQAKPGASLERIQAVTSLKRNAEVNDGAEAAQRVAVQGNPQKVDLNFQYSQHPPLSTRNRVPIQREISAITPILFSNLLLQRRKPGRTSLSQRVSEKEAIIVLKAAEALLKKGHAAAPPSKYRHRITTGNYNALWDLYKACTFMGKVDRRGWADAALLKLQKVTTSYTRVINQKIRIYQKKIKSLVDSNIKNAKDVVLILGRPSGISKKLERAKARSTCKEQVTSSGTNIPSRYRRRRIAKCSKRLLRTYREDMNVWRITANSLGDKVVNANTLIAALKRLRGLRHQISTLHIIGHGQGGVVLEIDKYGYPTAGSVTHTKSSIKKGMQYNKIRPPLRVNILYCSGGESPKGIGTVGKAFKAKVVRASVGVVSISLQSISFKHRGRAYILSSRTIRRPPRGLVIDDNFLKRLFSSNEGRKLLKLYDYIYGVNHLQKNPSYDIKLRNLINLFRRNKYGKIPLIAFADHPGKKGAVPYWKAEVWRRSKGAVDLTFFQQRQHIQKVVEVVLDAP